MIGWLKSFIGVVGVLAALLLAVGYARDEADLQRSYARGGGAVFGLLGVVGAVGLGVAVRLSRR